jgi:hypothetical protein
MPRRTRDATRALKHRKSQPALSGVIQPLRTSIDRVPEAIEVNALCNAKVASSKGQGTKAIWRGALLAKHGYLSGTLVVISGVTPYCRQLPEALWSTVGERLLLRT